MSRSASSFESRSRSPLPLCIVSCSVSFSLAINRRTVPPSTPSRFAISGIPIMSAMVLISGSFQSSSRPLDFPNAHIIAAPVVEAGGSRVRMSRHALRDLVAPAVRQIIRNPRAASLRRRVYRRQNPAARESLREVALTYPGVRQRILTFAFRPLPFCLAFAAPLGCSISEGLCPAPVAQRHLQRCIQITDRVGQAGAGMEAS
jgi:hypothetical protein